MPDPPRSQAPASTAHAGEPEPRAAGSPAAPRVWLVLGDKRGDNAQVEALAAHLPWRCERRTIALREEWVVGKPRVRPTLDHLDLARSDRLEPPWPDLVITIGRRPSSVALWIGEQSGGRTRLVLVGKPSGGMARFDLVIAGAEAQLPPLPNVLRVALPLMRVGREEVSAAVDTWKKRLADLPRPLVGILVGGPTGPFAFDDTVARRLLDLAREVADGGGTPYLTTSRRTPPAVVAALEAGLPAAGRLFRFSEGVPDNPYRALLGLADGLVVTADSTSMIVEGVRLRRPVAIFPLPPTRLGRLDQLRRRATRALFTPRLGVAGAWKRRLARALFRAGLASHTRDFSALHGHLVASGLAVWVGQPLRPPTGEVPDDLPRAAARVRALVEGDAPGARGASDAAGAFSST